MEPLSYPCIARALAGIEWVRRIEYRPTVSSTNDLAKQLGAGGAPEATLVIADEQTAGRGRLGRAWWSPPGAAIAMSLLLHPQFPPSLAYRLTMLAGLVAVQATEQVTGLHVSLKWPNDVVVAGPSAGVLKLGGILTETAISGESIEIAVVGIGLNVNVDCASRPDLPEATSLMKELGRSVDRLALVRALVERFADGYLKMAQDEWLYAEWSARLVTLGRQVVVHRGDETMTGWAEGVDTSGALLVRADDGRLHRVDAADVTLRDAGPHAGAPSRTDHERFT